MKNLVISVDFDGVICTIDYPRIGKLMTGAKHTINKWAEQGHKILINTCRSGVFLDDCRHFLDDNGISYHLINENLQDRIEQYGGDTRKLSFDIAFDDKNFGGFCGWKRADAAVQELSNRKPIIICIIGESGSGKSTLAEYIELQFGANLIQSYTTRARRTPAENGHTFISDEEFDKFDKEDMLAFTEFGGHRYCCLKSDVKDDNLYVLDEFGYQYLKDNFSDDYEVHSIRVLCGATEREKRVGKQRVDRDKGKFNMRVNEFDYFWQTDGWRDESPNRQRDYESLDSRVLQWLHRGWN